MILDNVPEYHLTELKMRIAIEAIFNRDSELLKLRLKLKDFAYAFNSLMARLSSTLVEFTSAAPDIDNIIEAAKKSGWKNLADVHKELFFRKQDLVALQEEMNNLLDERANR